MKNLFLTLFAATMSLAAMAQNDMWYWKKGKATKIESVDSISFAKPPVGSTNDYVDLGLSVKWATRNVGAENPEDYGDYFAWGETAPKSDYSWETYKFTTDGGNTFTKYTGSDNPLLDAKDDAAAANWGGLWRMPTEGEIRDLLNECTWEWQDFGNTEFGGVMGYKVTSNKPGYTDKYIFLPNTGYRIGTDLYYAMYRGYYWSATPYNIADGHNEEKCARRLFMRSDYHSNSLGDRYLGLTVRPVHP